MSDALTIQARVTCPHCWHEFAPEESLWIAAHPDLLGDKKLGDMHALRFLPSRFTVDGDAIDPENERTGRLACPECHLEVARPLYQISPIFFSILGAPSCGKSYFLASMTWRLRQLLPQHFGLAMTDTDPVSNARLHEYEEQQFLNPDPEQPVAIKKTEEQGDLYDEVNMGTHSVRLPRPFLFTIQPMASHPNYRRQKKVARVMCLYDNAGESFLPGADVTTSPVTRHLALSRCLFFLFDPTQDARFRKECEGKSNDPQMLPRKERLSREKNVRQDTILLEAIQRVRRHAGLREDQLHQRPLVIVVTKWDSWQSLLPGFSIESPWLKMPGNDLMVLDGKKLADISIALGKLLRRVTPEIVAAAEGFAQELYFLPVSATGRSPEVDASGGFSIRPKDMNPYWVEVPLLLALSKWCQGMIGSQNPEKDA